MPSGGCTLGDCILGWILAALGAVGVVIGGGALERGSLIALDLVAVGFCTMIGVISEDLALSTTGALKSKARKRGRGGRGGCYFRPKEKLAKRV